jgi:CDP-4-dehydro-6-deoxyglucose reductase
MSRLLTLTRAARLVGVTRGALQKKIVAGELATFEGMVTPEDLLRAYPNTRFDDNTAMERFTQIKDNAFTLRVRERILPDMDALLARLTTLGAELSQLKSQLSRYQELLARLDEHLAGMEQNDARLTPAFSALRAWMRSELEKSPGPADDTHALVIRDTLLRLMVAQVRLLPGGREFFVEGTDSILEAALRAGISLPYGCSDGSCGLCRARIVSGQSQPLRTASFKLSAEEQARGQVLLCCQAALTDLVIEAEQLVSARDIPRQQLVAKVQTVEFPQEDLAVLHLRTPASRRLRFLSGQRVHLDLGAGLTADHPVASCPCEERILQFHVRRRDGDAFSAKVFTGLSDPVGVGVEGPYGDFVLQEESERPLLFIAADDGFAPIKSLIEHALALDVAETVHLYWYGLRAQGRYLDNLCRAWADALDNFFYTPVTLQPAAHDAGLSIPALTASLERLVQAHPDLAAFDVYLAGPRAFVDVTGDFLRRHGLTDGRLHVDFTSEAGDADG